jgi:hypothetical protein
VVLNLCMVRLLKGVLGHRVGDAGAVGVELRGAG